MNSELTLYDYWRIINRRKWTALFIFAVTMVSTLFYTRMQPTVYRSQALIKIKPPSSYYKMPGSDVQDFDQWGTVATELKVIASSEISERAAVKLGISPGAKAASLAGAYKAELLADSNLISISAFDADPARAADIVSAVIDAYADFDLEQKTRQARKTMEDISGRKNEVEDSLRSYERQKQNFVENNPKTGLGDILANQLSDLEARKKELLEKYTSNHPDVVSLQRRIDAAEAKLEKIPAQEVALSRISREMRMQEELYTTLNKQYEEAKLGVSSMVSFVSVVNRPVPERTPISPNVQLNMTMGATLGLFIAIVAVFLLENLDVSISTIEDIEAFMKLPVLGIIPNILSEKPMDNWLTQFMKKERYSVDAFRSVLIVNRRYASSVIESYHSLRTNIMSNLNTKEAVSLVFSSAGAAEGKTLTAVNFSLACAHSGLKTLLVDADLRRPAVNQIFGTKKSPGLSDVLAGKEDWRDAMLESADFIMGGLDFDQLMRFPGIENLKILNSGTQPDNVIDILDSANWTELMEELKGEFDMIVFDSPPVLLFVDSVVISKHAADGVVLVYKAGKIARGALKRAKEQITGVNARMLGVVLNGVRASEMGPQYGYYYNDYKKYANR
ncbi:MAG TPA: hypothetical protein DCZ92_15420 [Elusimicrobia bacterium]|nr:MAG: hypothetical protein A2016_06665 [Elusimicrobia bacterium GWF2_62_30]HBA62169.1 hypothetical protein [Elusimicrobiota bacterium]